MTKEKIDSLLEKHFKSIEKIILSRQDPITGLLPASTAINAHGDYTDAWVRDNVYSILSVWGLSLSYAKYYEQHHRTHLLKQSVVKLMRGLLNAMMRQADRIEKYKTTLDPIDALHAKYGTSTGLAVVGDDEWGHLQLDATSLFVLMITQMSASGLKIIYTMDEVNFVQNLVHYISQTYCTPDYGIWERGNKINHGTPEINCSSVGMAKAALEAINGFNLFGNVATNEAVIHVVPNDIARSRLTLHSLLPRESNSKETDAALLSIIGYPAYGVEDAKLVKKTRDKIIKKLAGNYGCKRFLLDGHQSAIEDESRLHYEPSELREFENIESEWPLFFTYLLLDALMREDKDEIKIYKEKLAPLFVEEDGEKLLPELYIVPQELIEAEKQNPHSQTRVANENLPLVWAQSLYMLSEMIIEGVLQTSDIDPLNRRSRVNHLRNPMPMVSILAENESIQQKLLDLGINSQTLQDVKPIKIMHASELSKIHTLLGKNEKLALSGRPLLVSRTITTSRLYLIKGQKSVFLPYYFNPKGFYFSYDNKLLVEHFKASISFLCKHWDQSGQAIILFLVKESMLIDKTKDIVLDMLHQLQNGNCDAFKIKTGQLGQLLNTADIEKINNLPSYALTDLDLQTINSSTQVNHEKETKPLSMNEIQEITHFDDETLCNIVVFDSNICKKTEALYTLHQRYSKEFNINIKGEDKNILQIADEFYQEAAANQDWANIRRLADICNKYDSQLEDALLDIVVSQKRLAVGRAYSEKATLSTPQNNATIINTINQFCGHNPAESVLTQEIILHLSHLVRLEPELFSNMITLRAWYFAQLLVGQIAREKNIAIAKAYDILISYPPHTLYDQLKQVLKSYTNEVTKLIRQENIHVVGLSNVEDLKSNLNDENTPEITDWALWREQKSMIGSLNNKFYKDTWYLLQQCKALVIGDKYSLQNRLSSELTLESTAGERNFALIVDNLLQSISAHDYRQLNIEAIESLARVFRGSPELFIDDDIVLDVLIGHGVKIAWGEKHSLESYDEQKSLAWESFYKLSIAEVDNYLVESFKFLLTLSEDEK